MKYKYNGQWYDLSLPAFDSLPIGSIVPYAGSLIPDNYMLCEGQQLSKTAYPDLYATLGDNYNLVGDSDNTKFRLPNLKGRVPIGVDSNDSDFTNAGQTGGSKTNKLVPDNYKQRNWMNQVEGAQVDTYFSSGSTYSIALQYSQNDNTPVNNLQPYIVVNYIIKVSKSSIVTAEVKGTQTTSQTDTYSCDYINTETNYIYTELNGKQPLVDYSTSEVDTGKKWIDGKKIYSIVVPFTTGTSIGSWLSKNVAISNIDTILPNWELNINYSNYWYKVPNDIVVEVRISKSSTQLSIGYYMNGAGFTEQNAIAIVEYTKSS